MWKISWALTNQNAVVEKEAGVLQATANQSHTWAKSAAGIIF